MNLLAHAHVAIAVGRDAPGWVLGAVLPDLAPMAGVRVDRASLPAPIAAGVRCHVRTDAAFHANPVFLDGARSLRRALDRRGLASGPARAVGHAGWELLLDGTLLGSAAEAAFRRSMATGGEVASALSDDDARRWTDFLARGRSAPAMAYDDPRWVAERLARMLARRPRLRLPRHQVGTVADVLAGVRPAVAAAADEVLGTTVAAVATGAEAAGDGRG